MTTAMLGFVVGVLTYLSSRYFERVILAPRLKIVYDQYTGCNLTEIIPCQGRGTFDTTGLLRLIVVNESIIAAKGCRVYLTKIENKLDGRYMNTNFKDSLRLRWAYEDTNGAEFHQGLDIPKGVRFYVELLEFQRSRTGQQSLAVCWLTNPTRYENNLVMPQRVLRFTLVVTAENAEPYEFTVVADTSDHHLKVLQHEGKTHSFFIRQLDDYIKTMNDHH